MVRLIHVDEGTDGMRAATGQLARHLIGGAGHKGMRAIAIVKQVMLTNDPGNVGVPGHQPKRIKALALNSTKWLVRAKPLKSHKKRFLPRICLRRGDEKPKAMGYFFSLWHRHYLSHLARCRTSGLRLEAEVKVASSNVC
jgi:hypothetical protein